MSLKGKRARVLVFGDDDMAKLVAKLLNASGEFDALVVSEETAKIVKKELHDLPPGAMVSRDCWGTRDVH